MSLQVKHGGVWAGVAGVFIKRGGAYGAVDGLFAKAGGAYQPMLGPLPPRPVQVVTTQNRVFSAAESRAGKTRVYFRWPIVFGVDTASVILSLNGWYSSNAGEVAVANAYTIEACAIEIGDTAAPVRFGGSRSRVIDSGAVDVQSDELSAATAFGGTIARGTVGWVRGVASVEAAGQLIPFSPRSSQDYAGSQAAWFDPAATTPSSVDATGQFTTTGTAPEARVSTLCPIVLGRPAVSPGPSFIALGDSIGEGAGDSAAAGIHGKGFVQRAMRAADGASNPRPCLNFCRTGNDTPDVLGANVRWRSYIQYATHAIEEHGTNDLGSTGTGVTATIQTNISTLWGLLRAGGISKILRSELMPRTSSTSGDWLSAADQTVNTGWGAGEKSEQLNAWFAAQLGSGVDYIVSMASTRDPAAPQKWITTGAVDYPTADGTHPAPGGAELAAIALRAVLDAL